MGRIFRGALYDSESILLNTFELKVATVVLTLVPRSLVSWWISEGRLTRPSRISLATPGHF